MNRLYGARVNELQWKVIKIDGGNSYDSYRLVNRRTNYTYEFRSIIGLEQVSENEFLVFRRASYDDFEISRYKLQGSELVRTFSQRHSQFFFISKDRIMFNYWGNTGPYRCCGIYSIEDNKMLEEAKWLEDCAIQVHKDNENHGQIKLYIEKVIFSHKLGNQKLMFTVDPITLEPNSDCYSQFKDVFIKVSSKEDIDRIISEEKKEIKVIEEQAHQKEKEKLQRAREKVLIGNKEQK